MEYIPLTCLFYYRECSGREPETFLLENHGYIMLRGEKTFMGNMTLEQVNDMYLDVLREIGNIGAGFLRKNINVTWYLNIRRMRI